MLEQFLRHNDENTLFTKEDFVLLAVSGGMDSMVMVDLFLKGGFRVGIAHVNFLLRGKESLGDEDFVREYAHAHGIAFHVRQFDTKHYAEITGESIHEVARGLRYSFFDELIQKYAYTYVATAHHLNDSLETVLFHLTRGTGLEGLTGIPVKNGKVVRPLLFAARPSILGYAQKESLLWREDSSNAKDDYTRNHIRHHVVPELIKINPDLERGISLTLERLKGARMMEEAFRAEVFSKALETKGDMTWIRIPIGLAFPIKVMLLWEHLKGYGFNYLQCRDMASPHPSGKVFLAYAHRVTVDRDALILSPIFREEIREVSIGAGVRKVGNGLGEIEITSGQGLDKRACAACLDPAKVRFPLVWRVWREGDYFMPLGMAHPKKVSDFLIDIKLSAPEKEKVTVIESEGEIIWVVNFRISEKAKVTPLTTDILRLVYQPGKG